MPDTVLAGVTDPAAGVALLNRLLEKPGHFVAALTPEGAIVEANAAALEFLDAARRDIIGRALWDFVPDTELAERLRLAVSAAAGGEPVQQRLRLRAADGRSALTRLTFSLIRNARGSEDLVLAEGRDEPAASQTPDTQPSRDKYEGIVNISADAIICADADGRITDFNWGAERVFGYGARDVIGRPVDVLMPERYRSRHSEYLRSFAESTVAARRMGERREIVGLRRNGDEFPADASISKLEIDGRLVYTAVLRDITVQKRAEAAQRFLARAGSLLASSLDVATTFDSVARLATDFIADCCVIFDVNEAGEIRRVALAAADPDVDRILHKYRGRALSRSSPHPACRVIESGQPMLLADLAEAFEPSDAADELELFNRLRVHTAMLVPLVARGRISGAIALYGCGDGRRFDVDDLALAQELALGSALAVDNARLYEAARRAILARDDILAVVSHDLGSPLSAIRIAVSLLLRNAGQDAGPASDREHLIGIRTSIEQMERLIRDLLDVKRIEAGQLALDIRSVEPASLVNRAAELFRMIAERKSITIHVHAAAALPPVRADRGRIVQVLSNLVGNAIKFTASGGSVDIRAGSAGPGVRFSVLDDGPGIEAGDLVQIFDPFWRVRRGRDGEGGLGLGLAIVKGIVEAHGGRVWAESQPGAGTAMHFTLPLADTPPAD